MFCCCLVTCAVHAFTLYPDFSPNDTKWHIQTSGKVSFFGLLTKLGGWMHFVVLEMGQAIINNLRGLMHPKASECAWWGLCSAIVEILGCGPVMARRWREAFRSLHIGRAQSVFGALLSLAFPGRTPIWHSPFFPYHVSLANLPTCIL